MTKTTKTKNWFIELLRAWKLEFHTVFSDVGVLIFFFALPTLYPIAYTLIYNPEIADNLPVAIVDNSRTARSREFVRMLDAAQSVDVIGYASDMGEARRWYDAHDCVAIIELPADYAKRIGRGEQAVVPFYCDMSLLLRYRALLSTMTDMQLELGTQLRAQTIDHLGQMGQMAMGGSKTVGTEAIFLGDSTQGFASFVMPGIFVLILQQSLILGITMLAARRSEQRRRGMIVHSDYAPVGATLIGRTLCYLTIYAPLVLYIFSVVPWMFSLPDIGHLWEYCLYVLPMLIAATMLGITIGIFVTERESSMLVVVFTSIVFLFLSGLTWPRYGMNSFWLLISDMVPATWGVDGFIRMASDGGTLGQQHTPWLRMWLLAAIYGITATLVLYYYKRTAPKRDAR